VTGQEVSKEIGIPKNKKEPREKHENRKIQKCLPTKTRKEDTGGYLLKERGGRGWERGPHFNPSLLGLDDWNPRPRLTY